MNKVIALFNLLILWACTTMAISVPGKMPDLGISKSLPVQSGVWNANIRAVVQAARDQHVPAVVVYAKRGCPHCFRLMNAMKSDSFVAWQKERALLMGFHRPGLMLGKNAFIKEMTDSGVGLPVVCVYWPRKDGTEIKKIFAGNRGQMLGQKHEKLEGELIKAIDSVLGEYYATLPTHRSAEAILASEDKPPLEVKSETTSRPNMPHPSP